MSEQLSDQLYPAYLDHIRCISAYNEWCDHALFLMCVSVCVCVAVHICVSVSIPAPSTFVCGRVSVVT